MTDLRPEEIEDAKDALRAAIVTYFDRIDPGSYVHSWVVVAHTESLEASRVAQVVPGGQASPTTRGMLEIAIEIGTKSRKYT